MNPSTPRQIRPLLNPSALSTPKTLAESFHVQMKALEAKEELDFNGRVTSGLFRDLRSLARFLPSEGTSFKSQLRYLLDRYLAAAGPSLRMVPIQQIEELLLGVSEPFLAKIRNRFEKAALSVFPEKRQRRKKVFREEVEILGILQKQGGNRRNAAKELKVSQPWLTKQINEAPEGSLLAAFQFILGSGRRLKDVEMIAALQKHGGMRSAAAWELGICPHTLKRKIGWMGMSEGSVRRRERKVKAGLVRAIYFVMEKRLR